MARKEYKPFLMFSYPEQTAISMNRTKTRIIRDGSVTFSSSGRPPFSNAGKCWFGGLFALEAFADSRVD
jgi:hypothetical protein